jgi:hypothetical protein
MDDDEAGQGKKAKAATAALILGTFGLAAAAALPGLLAVACGVLGGTLVSFGLCTACGCKGESKTPCCWPEDDGVAESPAEPQALAVSPGTPQPSDHWRELAARSATASRSR